MLCGVSLVYWYSIKGGEVYEPMANSDRLMGLPPPFGETVTDEPYDLGVMPTYVP